MNRKFIRAFYSTNNFYLNEVPQRAIENYVQKYGSLLSGNFDGVTVKVADADDFTVIAESVDKFRSSTRIIDRTGRGDLCIVAYEGGALVHVRWAAVTSCPISELNNTTLHLNSHEGYLYDAYTLPAFRRKGFGGTARNFLIVYLAQQGIKTIYRISETDNPWTSEGRIKLNREGRQRTISLIEVTSVLGTKRCTFYAETAETQRTIARLFQLPISRIRVRTFDG